jgi:hypothetical protein
MIDVKALAESKMGAAGILRRGQLAAKRLGQQQSPSPKHLPPGEDLSKLFGIDVVDPSDGQKQAKQQQQQQNKSLSYLQQQAKHKGQIPSNKPFWKTLKHIGRKALSSRGIVGRGVVAGATAIDPGLGLLAAATQKIFGDHVEKSHVLSTLAVLTDARYPHRIPKVAKSPTDTNLDFTWGPDGMKKRRKKPMDKLINPNGQYIRT